MIRFATIGTSAITEKFLKDAKACGALNYAAAYSRNAEQAELFARKHGALNWYNELNDLAKAEEVDAVYIASPNRFHCEQAILMMTHGKHVLCEKPVSSNQAELERMMAEAEKNHVVFLEGMRSAFDPGFTVIQDNLHKLGIIRRVSFQYSQYSSRYDKFKRGIIENAFKPELSNGSLMDIGVYCVYPLVKLFGMPTRICSDAVFLKNGIDGAGTILAGYEDMQADLIYSKITNSKLPSQIQGENGCMWIREIAHPYEVKIFYNDGKEETLLSLAPEGDLSAEAKAWAEMIQRRGDSVPYQQISLMELRVMDEVRRQLGIIYPADLESDSKMGRNT